MYLCVKKFTGFPNTGVFEKRSNLFDFRHLVFAKTGEYCVHSLIPDSWFNSDDAES